MKLSNVAIFVFDEKENFNKTSDLIADTRQIKALVQINSLDEFESCLARLEEDVYICLIVHVFHAHNIKGTSKYKISGINKKYPLINAMYVSEGSTEKIKKNMIDQQIDIKEIYKYHQITENIENEKIKLYTKKELLSGTTKRLEDVQKSKSTLKNGKIKYAVITALPEEFNELKEYFDFSDDEHFEIGRIKFFVGSFKEDRSKKIISSIPTEPGMVDAAIFSTILLEYMRPDYLIMTGVCGGYYEMNHGDIVFANKVFTFQKGKISDLNKKDETGELKKIELFDKNRQSIDYDHLYDEEGNQIIISLEKFDRELQNVNLTHLTISLEQQKSDIERSINETIKGYNLAEGYKDIKIHIGPMTCSTMVINKDGFFDDSIRIIDRKAVAVEMESYGVARACEIANEGKTKAIIFKSVMDNTKHKTDGSKKFAARTSALFLKELFSKNII